MNNTNARPQTPNKIQAAIAKWLGLNNQTSSSPIPTMTDSWDYDVPAVQVLMGNGNESALSRNDIYAKYQQMISDSIIGSALKLHVTAALGGHESKGETVFIEVSPSAQKDPAKVKIVEEIKRDLSGHLNRIAATAAFNAVGYGDSYARIYTEPKKGVVDLYVDEMVLPPLIQAYERGNKTIGFRVESGKNWREDLDISQMARFKMPRMIYQPQMRIQEKLFRLMMRENDLNKLLALPALVGGSLLDGCEVAYDRLSTALSSLVGSRLLDSIDESMVGVNQVGATVSQKRDFLSSMQKMFDRSKKYALDVIKSGKPSFGRIVHTIPVSNEKQLISVQGAMGGNGVKQSYTVDDVMMHARLLSGSLGLDLSMLGFADQLSGGLGDGGFFRVSAQAAQCSANIRNALTEGFNHIINVHCLTKYGIAFEANDMPWNISYYSGISALESERSKTAETKIGAAGLLIQSMTAMKDLGLDENAMIFMLKEQFGLQENEAKIYAAQLAKKAPVDEGGGEE